MLETAPKPRPRSSTCVLCTHQSRHRISRRPNGAPRPAILTRAHLADMLQRLPRGQAAGPSGLTYEQVHAAANSGQACFIASLRLVNTIASGDLPHVPRLLDCRLVPMPTAGRLTGRTAYAPATYSLTPETHKLCCKETSRPKAAAPGRDETSAASWS